MSYFSILHLSDIHINSKEKPEQERLRKELNNDIKEVCKKNNIVLDIAAVTGDIVDRGGNDESYIKANKYFEDLTSIDVGINKESILFAPGNHDIQRTPPIKNLIDGISESDIYDKNSFLEYWDLIDKRFTKFDNFVKGVNSNLKPSQFGGCFYPIKCENGIINIFLLNSSWMSIGDNDYNKLLIGKWQLEELNTLYKDRENKLINIALMHHPIDWLTDKDTVSSFLVNESCLSINLILHGHIHTNDIKTISTPDESLTTLVSGIGYPKADDRVKGEMKLEDCRYSIYRINLDNLETEIWLRKSNKRGSFCADTELYEKGKESGNFKIPLEIQREANEQCSASLEIDSNFPFEVDPIPLVNEWVGRNDILNDFDFKNIRALAITGVGGQGKSALASELLRRYSLNGNNYNMGLWVDCRELTNSLHVKLIQVLEVISAGSETFSLFKDEKIEDTVKRLMAHLRKRKVIVVFDNVDAYINGDEESPIGDLKNIFESVINSSHMSTVIFTCRPPINDSRGSFVHYKLIGLTADEGIELFKKRGISLKDEENSEEYCRKIIKLTEGHPWWLGLIAGQISSNHDSLKKCVERFSTSEYNNRKKINFYFKDVWEYLKDNNKNILRYLTESPYPLTITEIEQIVDGINYNRISRSLNQLKRYGLVIEHQRDTYNVHPLVREFIHDNYNQSYQKPYVTNLLYLYLPKNIVDVLFSALSSSDRIDTKSIGVE